jgi:hypothetical protein
MMRRDLGTWSTLWASMRARSTASKQALQGAIPDLACEDPEGLRLAIILTTADKESPGKLRATSTNDSRD